MKMRNPRMTVKEKNAEVGAGTDVKQNLNLQIFCPLLQEVGRNIWQGSQSMDNIYN